MLLASGSGIGSSLQVPDLRGAHDLEQFFPAWAANASGIRLPCLHYCQQSYASTESLIGCLPKLVHLKQLSMSYVVRAISNRSIIDALRQNGSMQQTEMLRGIDDLISETESIQVQSYCKRNKMIPILATQCHPDDLPILPLLFWSAKQAPRTAPNAILIALLVAGDSIGPRYHGRKRARPSDVSV